MNVNELHKPRVRRQTQPIADALPWGYAANFKRSVRLPLYHGNITVLGILPDGARGSRGLNWGLKTEQLSMVELKLVNLKVTLSGCMDLGIDEDMGREGSAPKIEGAVPVFCKDQPPWV
ncbi:hypothetical protein EIP86_005927 [Pleurotus ostreatoroseus]|nr:hypothetical protein EIP86_005927 [Pleurotus ostreatoroseus]